jgi:hypothetical protein
VLAALAEHADADSRQCWPTVGLLASETKLTERSVQRALADLQALRELRVDVHGAPVKGRQQWRPSLFTLFPEVTPVSPQEVPLVVTENGSCGDSQRVLVVTQVSPPLKEEPSVNRQEPSEPLVVTQVSPLEPGARQFVEAFLDAFVEHKRRTSTLKDPVGFRRWVEKTHGGWVAEKFRRRTSYRPSELVDRADVELELWLREQKQAG